MEVVTKNALLNILMNTILTVFFVALNMWALSNNFEETFVSLALFYGIIVVTANAIFVLIVFKKLSLQHK